MAIINGTFNPDRLTGTAAADVIDGGLGNDTLNGGGGSDLLVGGWDDDSIVSTSGNDTIIGDAGNFGDSDGNDTIASGDGADDVFSWRGSDSIDAGRGDDFINAWTESNIVLAGAGNDTIMAVGPFADFLNGGPGNDRIESGDSFYTPLVPPFPGGSDTVVGGGGADTFVANGSNDLNGDVFLDFSADDLIVLNGPVLAAQRITVPAGNVFVDIDASPLNELLLFFANQTAGTFIVTPTPSQFRTTVSFVPSGPIASQTGTAGNDRLVGGDTRNDTLVGLAGNDTLVGLGGGDSLVGGPGADSLRGGAGVDTLIGGTGNDQLTSGPGTDWFTWTATSFVGGDVAAGVTDTVGAVPGGGDRLNFSAALEALLEVNNVSLAAAAGNVAIGGAFGTGTTNIRFSAATDRLQIDLNGNATFDTGDFQIVLAGISSVTYLAGNDSFLLA
jgi:Ca2+-binding RTX toxin-like protein